MDMSIPYESVGRVKQKMRTRNSLVESARALIAQGVTPTVEDAAAAASISRTTAYRYFTNQRELLIAAHPLVDAESLLGDDPPEDIVERVDRVVGAILQSTVQDEVALRTMLRLSLEGRSDQLLLRRGRAIGWLKDALAPLDAPPAEVARIAYAVRATAGIESLVWLCDVAGMSREEAVALMTWSARALVRTALDELQPGANRPPASAPAPRTRNTPRSRGVDKRLGEARRRR